MPTPKVKLSAIDKVKRCVRLLEDKKAKDIVALDVRSLASFTDYFIICSATSRRQVQALAQHLEEELATQGIKPLGVEGAQEGLWILLDFNDVVVHIFHQPWREFYDLEGLWLEAPRQTFPAGRTVAAGEGATAASTT